jgi:hypothetical protein
MESAHIDLSMVGSASQGNDANTNRTQTSTTAAMKPSTYVEDGFPHVTFSQALQMADSIGFRMDKSKAPKDPNNHWITFEDFVHLFRPDPEHPLRKVMSQFFFPLPPFFFFF